VIYYEFLKPGETVNTERYRQQMINLNQILCEKRPEYQKKQHKVILLPDNAPSHSKNWSRKRLRHLVGKYFRMRLTHQTWLRPITTYLHRGHALAQQRFTSYEDVRKWLIWLKRATIFLAWHPQIVKQVEKMYSYDGQYFEKYFLSFSCNKRVFSIKKF